MQDEGIDDIDIFKNKIALYGSKVTKPFIKIVDFK